MPPEYSIPLIVLGIWLWCLGAAASMWFEPTFIKKDRFMWFLSFFVWWLVLPYQLWGMRHFDIYRYLWNESWIKDNG
ncbi:MAG: hypothetical protein KBD50_00420 [Candidatus Pacebacteria bacterium]|nr:hypothetical protein [Candidatus Paceibacterota bacterium]